MISIRRVFTLGRRFSRMNWALADQSVVSITGFVTTYLMALSMPVSDFGIYTLLFTALMASVGLQNALVTQPHNILGAKLAEDAYVSFTSALALLQVVLSLGIGACIAIAGITMSVVGLPSAGGVVLLGVVAVPWTMQEFVRRTFYTHSESRGAFLNDAVAYGLQLLGIAMLMRSGALTLESALVVMGGSSLLATILGLWQMRGSLAREPGSYNSAALLMAWRRSWVFSRWLTARAVAVWIRAHGHTWILAGLLGPAAVGVFRAVENIANVLNPVSMAVQSYVPARASTVFARNGPTGLKAWMKRNSLIAGSIYALIVLVVIVAAEPLLELFYGGRFSEVSPYLEWVLAFSALEKLLAKFSSFPTSVLLVLEQTREIFLVDLVSVATLIAAGLTLITAFGLIGTPLAKFIAASLTLALLLWRAKILIDRPAAADTSGADVTVTPPIVP